MSNANVYTTSQIKAIEALAEKQAGLSKTALMQRAGHAALFALKDAWPQARYITVVCGPGNNGGDGYVLAYLAHRLGLHVIVQQVGTTEKFSMAAQEALSLCQKERVHIEAFQGELKAADLIVDALFGTGFSGAVDAPYIAAIDSINTSGLPVLAIDIPSGIDANTASFENVAVKADVTVTFVGLKPGLLTGHGLEMSGKVILNTLQLPKNILEQAPSIGKSFAYTDMGAILPRRSLNANKSDFGHLLIVGGNLGFNGAVRIAAEAALRLGTGLVSVATHPAHAAFVNTHYPEIMSHPIIRARQLDTLIEKATAIVVGPGLGQDAWAKSLFKKVLSSNKPLVVDADGLNLLAANPTHRKQWVLTPHPGEAARLLKTSIADIQANRMQAVEALYQQYDGVCLLKGAGTLIQSHMDSLHILRDGNPGMASAGMGDALSGIIGGLLARGLSLMDATRKGSALHARAADIAAQDGEQGLLATDVIPVIKQLLNS